MPKLVAWLAILTGIPSLDAQSLSQKDQTSISGFPQNDGPPQVQPGPRREVGSLIKSLSTNDAMFEVIVGQGRLLTLNTDIVAPGKAKPLIAVGDPSVIAAELVGIRQIRVIGERIGVTDLGITTPDGQTYNLEVRVVADLDVLRAQLNSLFPRTKLKRQFPDLEELKVYQIRDHLIVEGMASDVAERDHILETIKAYLESIRTSQARKIRAESGQGELVPGPANRLVPSRSGQPRASTPADAQAERAPGTEVEVGPERQRLDIEAPIAQPHIIDLLRIPDPPKPPDPLLLLDAKLREIFPDASLELEWIVDHVVVKGQARDGGQVSRIIQTIQGFLESAKTSEESGGVSSVAQAGLSGEGPLVVSGNGKVINLIRVPGPQQVLLKVEVAELNRTALRQLGVSWFFNDQITFIGTNISGAFSPFSLEQGGRIAARFTNPTTTVAGIRFTDNGSFQYWIDALRRNSVLKILAEPNLVAMNGQEANFLAGGEFPVPVPQAAGGVGSQAVVTIQYKKFGVQLAFVPTILDGDKVRLSVDPEVSSIDFDLGIELNGFRVPGLNSRRAHTVVELRQGQTLAIAGLMQLELAGATKRIPGFGDLPVIGPFFSNNTGGRLEKELMVLVTPYLVLPMEAEQVPGRPGDEIKEPNDLEFYFLGRIESRTGKNFRSTTQWDDPFHMVELMRLEQEYLCGAAGFSR